MCIKEVFIYSLSAGGVGSSSYVPQCSVFSPSWWRNENQQNKKVSDSLLVDAPYNFKVDWWTMGGWPQVCFRRPASSWAGRPWSPLQSREDCWHLPVASWGGLHKTHKQNWNKKNTQEIGIAQTNGRVWKSYHTGKFKCDLISIHSFTERSSSLLETQFCSSRLLISVNIWHIVILRKLSTSLTDVWQLLLKFHRPQSCKLSHTSHNQTGLLWKFKQSGMSVKVIL